MSDDRIEGFLVGGTTQIMIANYGAGVMLTMKRRDGEVDATLSVDQSRRLRRLLAAAEKRTRS